MSALVLGYSGYVCVKDTQGRELYKKKIKSNQEITPWMEVNKPSVQGWGILKSSFVPVRVDNLADFGRDLFLPTFVNHVSKIQNVFLKILAAIFAIPWDPLTFPVRCITAPMRWAYHLRASKKESSLPVIDLINTSPHFEEAMKVGFVHLEAHTSDIKATQVMGDFPLSDIKDTQIMRKFLLQGNQVKTYRKWANEPSMAEETTHKETRLVNLKALPWCQEESSRKDGTTEYARDLERGVWHKGWESYCSGSNSSTSG